MQYVLEESDLYNSEPDSEFSQTTIEGETEEELILNEDESYAELDDSIPSTNSNKRVMLYKFYASCFFSRIA